MTHAIIRGKNGRRHEVDFEDAPVRVEVYASEETVEIFVEADFETQAEEHRRFVILNIPKLQAKRRSVRRSGRSAGADARTKAKLSSFPSTLDLNADRRNHVGSAPGSHTRLTCRPMSVVTASRRCCRSSAMRLDSFSAAARNARTDEAYE